MAVAQQGAAPVRPVGTDGASGGDGCGAVRAERLDGGNGPARAAARGAARASPGRLAAGGQVRRAPGGHARRGDMRALDGGQPARSWAAGISVWNAFTVRAVIAGP